MTNIVVASTHITGEHMNEQVKIEAFDRYYVNVIKPTGATITVLRKEEMENLINRGCVNILSSDTYIMSKASYEALVRTTAEAEKDLAEYKAAHAKRPRRGRPPKNRSK